MKIFHSSTNTIAKVSIFGSIFFLAFFAWIFSELLRSSYATRQGVVLKQPVPFSHDHHVAGLGIDCRYCHTSVETSSFAGIPPTATCMNCHSQIWTSADILAPVRESYKSNRPLQWVRVHRLPDFVHFNHSIHIAKGIGCASCHGRIDKMNFVYQASPLTMEWCIQCHRNPEKQIRPREEVFNMAYVPKNQETLGPELVKRYGVKSMTHCSTCHY